MSLNCQSKARGREESGQGFSCGKGLSHTGCRRGTARRILLFSPARVLGFTLMTAYVALPRYLTTTRTLECKSQAIYLQYSMLIPQMESGFPRKICPNVHNSGQVCMFQGKNSRNFKAFTSIAQDTPGRTDLDWATLLDRHRLTDRSLHPRFNAHAVGTQVVGEVFGGHVQRVQQVSRGHYI